MPNTELANTAMKALKKARLTSRQAADRMGMDNSTVWKILKGGSVTPQTLLRFAEATGEDPAKLIRIAHPELAAISHLPEEAHGIQETSGAYIPTPSTHELPVLGTLRADTMIQPDEHDGGERFPVTEDHVSHSVFRR